MKSTKKLKTKMSDKPFLPKIGDVVDVRTTRFGRATVKIRRIDDEWIDTEIIKGKLVGMTDEWLPGDTKTLRISHCTFYQSTK